MLGLISATTLGSELLHDYGWLSVSTPLGIPLGLCLPLDTGRLVTLASWSARRVPLGDPRPGGGAILRAIANLGNSILANNASRSLAKLKAHYPQAFTDVALFARALGILDQHPLRLQIRRYVWDLFDVTLDQSVIPRLLEPNEGHDVEEDDSVSDHAESEDDELPQGTHPTPAVKAPQRRVVGFSSG